MVPPPDVAGLLAFKIVVFDTPQFTILTARTGGDYGLDATATSIYHGSFPLQTYQQDPLGRPRRPRPRPAAPRPRLQSQRQRLHRLLRNPLRRDGRRKHHRPEHGRQTLRQQTFRLHRVQQPGDALPAEPDHLRLRAAPRSKSSPTTAAPTSAEAPWPQMTGCDQLSFNPSLYAQPTTTETDSASGIDVNLTVPAAAEPDDPLAHRAARRRRSPCRPGFSINPNAADGKTSCSDAEAQLRHDRRRQLPRVLQDRQPDDRQLGPAGPAARLRLPRANRCPGTATASSSSPTASRPTSSSPARSAPIR